MSKKRRYKPKDGCRTVWLKVTDDEYELPVAFGDTAEDLARECGTTAGSIISSVSKAKRGVYKSTPYRKVRIEIEDERSDHGD